MDVYFWGHSGNAVQAGGLPYHDTYLVGCSTHEEAEAKIKDLYPSEPNIGLYVSPLCVGDTKDLKLARNEVREWQ
jgi:hypothetical protein